MAHSKEEMLFVLNLKNNIELPEEYIKYLYNGKVKSKKKTDVTVKNDKKINIDMSTDKYKVVLSFINKILENLKKDKIHDLRDFKNIDRDDIISDINKKTFDDMKDIIFEHFSKQRCGWYERSKIKNYILSIIRRMCKDIGLMFKYVKKDISNGNYHKSHLFYSIQ